MGTFKNKMENFQNDFDCFKDIEANIKISLPTDLKNVLIINGYTNSLILSQLSEDDLEQMEKFMAETAPNLIEKEKYQEYYGIFHKNPENFKFVPGHKKLVNLVVSYLKRKSLLDSCPTREKRSNLDLHKYSAASTSVASSEENNLQSDDSSALLSFFNLTGEAAHISRTVRNWLKSKCGNNNEKWMYFKEKFLDISFETKITNYNELCCIIKCFCKSSCKILKASKKPNYSERWIFGNIHKHLNIHLSNYLDSNPSTSLACQLPTHSLIFEHGKKQKAQQTLMKFVTVSKCNTTEPDNSSHDLDHSYNNIKLVTENTELDDKHKLDIMDPLHLEDSFDLKNTTEGNNEETNDLGIKSEPSRKIKILDNQILNPALDPSTYTNIKTSIKNNAIYKSAAPETNLRQLRTTAVSKWTSNKYKKSERIKRKRENIMNQPLITSFYSFVEEVNTVVNNVIEERQELEQHLQTALESLPDLSNRPRQESRGQLLKMLLEVSLTNSKRSRCRNVFNETIKKFSLYLFYVGGRLLYETIYENMKNALPSISSLNNYVNKNTAKIEEGIFDYDGLNAFLEERNLPKVVWISEDGTRITGKVEYDQKTNKLIGFTMPLHNGLPKTDTFLATSAKEIQHHFTYSTKSNYAYLIMAQPLSTSAPAYCLSVYGTDNKFNSNDVVQRWNNIKLNAEKRGITILGFSGDGDTRVLKAMRQCAILPPPEKHIKSYDWDWFQSGYEKNEPVTYVQDTVHIATKLRTRFLNPNVILRLGNFVACADHLQELISKFSKDKHMLTSSDIKLEDKMNFRAAEKICSPEVISLLEQIPESRGTCSYLKLMNMTITSYLDNTLDIRKRLYNIWYCVFFSRIWRKWLSNHPNYKISDNFITSNCYTCLELNGHALIHVISYFRRSPDVESDMFIPSLFSSQTCEKMFRATRSMTSTFSTVVNFSMKDIMQRLNRIKAINNILNDLKGTFIFPREDKKDTLIKYCNNTSSNDVKYLTDEQINSTLDSALKDALCNAQQLGMFVEEGSWNCVSIPVLADTVMAEEDFENNIDHDLVNETNEKCDLEILKSLPIENENNNLHDPNSDIHSDMCNISIAGLGGDLIVKDFSIKFNTEEKDDLYEKGPLVKVAVGNKSVVIKKSSLCWLLEETKDKISTDRLRRFIASSNATQTIQRKRKTEIQSSGRTSKGGRNKRKFQTKCLDSDDNSTDSEIPYDDSTDTEHFSDDMVSEDEDSTENIGSDFGVTVECNKFYAVYYEEKWYLGRVECALNKETFKMNFLRKSRKSDELSFFWPKIEDVDNVKKEFIFHGPIDFDSNSSQDCLYLSRSQYINICEKYRSFKKQ